MPTVLIGRPPHFRKELLEIFARYFGLVPGASRAGASCPCLSDVESGPGDPKSRMLQLPQLDDEVRRISASPAELQDSEKKELGPGAAVLLQLADFAASEALMRIKYKASLPRLQSSGGDAHMWFVRVSPATLLSGYLAWQQSPQKWLAHAAGFPLQCCTLFSL